MEKKKEDHKRKEWKKRVWRLPQNPLVAHKVISIVVIDIIFVVLAVAFFCKFSGSFQLDQYMETICSTTAAITATMFGLSAASYAFVCSELRAEERNRPNLNQVLIKYRDHMWAEFIYSLVFTFETVISSIIILEFAQKLGTAGLFPITLAEGGHANNLRAISTLTFFNSLIAVVAICVMVKFNYNIFRREDRYSTIAVKLCKESLKPYQELMVQTSNSASAKKREKRRDLTDFEKIHNIEILIDRILKNHSCMGDAFAPDHRRERLLSEVFIQKIERDYHLSDDDDGTCGKNDINPELKDDPTKGQLKSSTSKTATRQEVCREYANKNKDYIRNQNGKRATNKFKTPPQECNFVQVYDDLICYRNCKLILQNSGKDRNTPPGDFLRKSAKKRILLFLLREETFSGMDLSRISLSGADVRHVDFSNCDLSGASLKGTNCEGADFSRSKLQGMYFYDNASCTGEIEVSCIDENIEEWNPYTSKEATCFIGASFTGADVSRAFLVMPEPETGKPASKGHDKPLFPFKNSSFNYAKLFSSRFGRIDFSQCDMERALIFDSIFYYCKANATNFKGATLTNSCLLHSGFENANMEEANLPQTVLHHSCFQRTNVKNANFSGANIVGCDFSSAYCQGASFSGIIQKVDGKNGMKSKPFFKENPFLKNIFDKVKPAKIKFDYATLSDTDFSGSNVTSISFKNTIGSNCIFTMAKITAGNFSQAFLTKSIFNNSNLKICTFSSTVLRESVFINSHFEFCKFTGTDFSRSIFECDMAGNGISKSGKPKFIFDGGTLVDSNFSGAVGLSIECFRNTQIIGCNFKDTGLRKADFCSAKIKIEDCIFD